MTEPISENREIVRNRSIFFFGGYENASAEDQFKRLSRELGRFEGTWNLKSTPDEPKFNSDHSSLFWTIETEAPNWSVTTKFNYCAWNDLIAEDFARPDWRAIPAGIVALLDFIVTGTAFRYFAVAWRYGLFFCYALFLVALFALATTLIVAGIGRLGVPMPWYVAGPLWLVVLWGLLLWPGERFHARYMLNDWSFASAIAWGRRCSYSQRLDTFARHIEETASRGDTDEILIVGHSLGAVLAAEALAGALRRNPNLAKSAPPITLMTVGSSLLKVGLHPGAKSLHRAMETILATPQIAWIDYTALIDALNFYKADPVRILRLDSNRSPVLRTVKIRAMLGEQAYRRFQYNLLRVHRQFVMGNGLRYHYDFNMSCCGPMPQARRIENPTLSVDNFADDGTYLPALRDEGPAQNAVGT